MSSDGKTISVMNLEYSEPFKSNDASTIHSQFAIIANNGCQCLDSI